VSGVLSLVGELLSRLNGVLGRTTCPGEWLWTTAVAGALFGLAPVLAAVLVALVRHGTGNHYSPPTTVFFGLLGAFGAVVPLLGFAATASVLAMVAAGTGGPGLDGADVARLQQGTCLVSSQAGYLGGGRTVGAALTALPGPDLLVAGRVVALLMVLPSLALVVAWALARLAIRQGPPWPGRLLWVPFLAVLAGTLPLAEGAVGSCGSVTSPSRCPARCSLRWWGDRGTACSSRSPNPSRRRSPRPCPPRPGPGWRPIPGRSRWRWGASPPAHRRRPVPAAVSAGCGRSGAAVSVPCGSPGTPCSIAMSR